jgi:membrane-associated HD superfamily phosphohydrolase
MKQLEEGIDTLKLPNEQFAFKYRGNESYRSFIDTKALYEYLQHYKGFSSQSMSTKPEDMQEDFDAITIFRLHPNTVNENLPTIRERKARAAQRRAEKIARGEWIVRRTKPKSIQDRMRNWDQKRIDAFYAKRDEVNKRYIDKIKNDPVKYAEYKAKERERKKRK